MRKRNIYPFAAIVGQEKMKTALILNIINPKLSGVLIRGEKGTAKSTAVRSLAAILPAIATVQDCPFQLPPKTDLSTCRQCSREECRVRMLNGDQVEITSRSTKVVELPLGSTEDRVVGTMDIEHALKKGERRVEPGILAAAHRGILYVDEVNLLDDHVVDVLLDSAAMGINTIEREGISFSHPARFTLVGTMNPEEGELRPQLLDRFGLCVNIEGIANLEERVAVMARRTAFDDDPESFCSMWEAESESISQKIIAAREIYPEVKIEDSLLYEIAACCLEVGVDGHRGDIILLKTAKTLAAYNQRTSVLSSDVEDAAELALPHRARRQPLQEMATEVSRIRLRNQS